MTGHGNSHVSRILALKKAGLRQARIAERLGISPASVSQAIKRNRPKGVNFKKASLAPEIVQWIEAEAQKSNVDFDDMALAIFTDAALELYSRETSC